MTNIQGHLLLILVSGLADSLLLQSSYDKGSPSNVISVETLSRWREDVIGSEYFLEIVECHQRQVLGDMFWRIFNLTYAHQRNADLRHQLTRPDSSISGIRYTSIRISVGVVPRNQKNLTHWRN